MRLRNIQINRQKISISGTLVRVAQLDDEWFGDVEDPPSLVDAILEAKCKVDLFTFCQRLPDTIPKFNYPMEWEDIAVVPVSSFEHWLNNQINDGAKKAVRKAQRAGVVCRLVPFDDELVRGIESVLNETPIRQGRRFIHYGKTFGEIKEEFSQGLQDCDFIGAYFREDLIGFIKLAHSGKYAVPFGMVSKLQHRDKAPQNALIATAIQECARKGIQYFVYGKWSTGGLGAFKRHNGCQRIRLPKYYIPITVKGEIGLRLGLHHGVTGVLPERFRRIFSRMRSSYYSRQVKERGCSTDR